jgi:hypothetical protein
LIYINIGRERTSLLDICFNILSFKIEFKRENLEKWSDLQLAIRIKYDIYWQLHGLKKFTSNHIINILYLQHLSFRIKIDTLNPLFLIENLIIKERIILSFYG